MFLPLAGALIVGLPGVLLAVWFSFVSHRNWLRGGVAATAKGWLIYIVSIAGVVTALGAPFIHTGFGLLYNALLCFFVLAIAGGIPSAVIALVVSCLTYWLSDSHDEYDSNTTGIVTLGAVSGILAALPALQLSVYVMNYFWHK
jgi:hypothetical protein